ncbi:MULTISPECIES: GntP family permease [unclassified Paenarthrobacter]|uniref:GntP family permease n=1 Tax=unclassified Paenarthrobacter TaxID=2634190 RepID=UPI00381E2858
MVDIAMDNSMWVILAAVLAVAALMVLVIRFKFQEFLALLVVSIGFGLAIGIDPAALMKLVVDSMGGELGQLALVIGLGAIFGTVLQRSGAAERIATTLISRFSEGKVAWGLGAAGFLVSISIYIDVAIVVLVPMLYGIAQRTGKSLLYYGIPLCAGLSVAYTFMPPAPGPLAAAAIMNADLGLVAMFGLICGIPAVIVGGPLFGRFISKRIFVPVPEELYMRSTSNVVSRVPATGRGGTSAGAGGDEEEVAEATGPGFAAVLGTLLIPLLLIVLGSIARNVLPEALPGRSVILFFGHPVIALLITCLHTLWFFGVRRGASKEDLHKMVSDALHPAGLIILITGAGGVFGELLIESGLGEMLAKAMQDAGMPLIVFGFLTSAVTRICQGSGMIAMVTGATIAAPIAQALNASAPTIALTSIAIACGGAAFSHVNDSGFWMASRYFGMSVADTLKTWTVMKTLVGLTGFASVLTLSAFVS